MTSLNYHFYAPHNYNPNPFTLCRMNRFLGYSGIRSITRPALTFTLNQSQFVRPIAMDNRLVNQCLESKSPYVGNG